MKRWWRRRCKHKEEVGIDCPKCGYAMGPFDEECPRCAKMQAQQQAQQEYPPIQPSRPSPEPATQQQQPGQQPATWAIVSLILGIVSFCSMGIAGPFAIWAGVASNRKQENSGMAIGGIVLGAIGSVGLVVYMLTILLPVLGQATTRAHEATAPSSWPSTQEPIRPPTATRQTSRQTTPQRASPQDHSWSMPPPPIIPQPTSPSSGYSAPSAPGGVVYCNAYYTQSAFERGSLWSPEQGYTFVGVYVYISNQSNAEVPVHSWDFSFIVNGVEYTGSFTGEATLRDDCPPLQGVKLHPGGYTQGWLAYEVPLGWHSGLEFVWQPSLWFSRGPIEMTFQQAWF